MLGPSTNEHYVRLSEDLTTFEPMDQINSVFFDPPKQQLFSVKARGAMGVTVKNPTYSETLNFCIEDRGEILCIKFSTGNKVLGIQRKSNSVDFLNFVDGVPDGGEYSQQCKGKSAHLLGFVWCVSLEVLFITSEQLELYQVFPSKGNLRLLKQIALSSCWFAWDFASHIIVCCTGGSTVVCQAFQLGSSNSISKLGKFELPTGPAINSPSDITAFLQNHCLLTTVYGHPYFFLVSRDAESSARGETTTMVNMYRIYSDGSTDLTDILLMNSDGPIAINIVDNLILVHTQPERTDCVFDIALAYRVQNKTIRHHPVVYPKSIAPLILASSSVPLLVSNVGDTIPVELYSADWVTNLPNVVIDGRLGCLWTLQVNIDVLWRLIEKRMDVIDLLLSRANGKQCILEYCRELALESIEDAARYDSVPSNDYTFCGTGLAARLDDFAYVFKRLAEVSRRSHRTGSYACAVPSEETNEESVPPVPVPKQSSVPDEEPSILSKPHRPFTIQQSEVYTNVFLVAQGNEDKHVRSFFYAVLVEYMRSLMECDIPIEHTFQELLVSLLARLEQCSQLSYCIQNRFLSDSKPIALQLLALEPTYPAAVQLAIDMLKRLKFCDEEIVEVLMLKNHLIETLRFCQMRPGFVQQLTGLPKRLLLLAEQSGDRSAFYNTFRFFYQMGTNNPTSVEDPEYTALAEKFNAMFDVSAC